MKASTNTTLKHAFRSQKVTEDEIRDYAFHLYVQGGHRHGSDVDYWREAEDCLRANLDRPELQEVPRDVEECSKRSGS